MTALHSKTVVDIDGLPLAVDAAYSDQKPLVSVVQLIRRIISLCFALRFNGPAVLAVAGEALGDDRVERFIYEGSSARVNAPLLQRFGHDVKSRVTVVLPRARRFAVARAFPFQLHLLIRVLALCAFGDDSL